MTAPELSRILLVEDEPDIQAVAQIALETIGGFTVRICGSGEEAVEAAAEDRPDLVLLDVMLPGLDGPATLEALRRLPYIRETPVVFMTAKVMSSEVTQLAALDVAGIIQKPFDPMKLAAEVRKIWASCHG